MASNPCFFFFTSVETLTVRVRLNVPPTSILDMQLLPEAMAIITVFSWQGRLPPPGEHNSSAWGIDCVDGENPAILWLKERKIALSMAGFRL